MLYEKMTKLNHQIYILLYKKHIFMCRLALPLVYYGKENL